MMGARLGGAHGGHLLDWVIDTTQQFLAEHILLTVAVVLFIEELGVPLFAPGDILMVLAGIEVARGNAILWQVLLVEQVVTMAGATLLYYASRRLGRPALVKYGGYIGMDPERLEVMEDRLRQYQFRAVVLGRLTPGLRILIVIAAGLANLEARRFLPALALGSFLYLLLYTLVGMYAGEAAIRLITQLSIPASALLSLLALGVLALGLRHARRSRFLAQPLTPSLLTNLGAGVVAAKALGGAPGATVASSESMSTTPSSTRRAPSSASTVNVKGSGKGADTKPVHRTDT